MKRVLPFLVVLLALVLVQSPVDAQPLPAPSGVWTPDRGDGTYKNPILYADYSDPDVIRVGDDYYMTSSSFSHFPGLPILHSKDLVNWSIIGHAAPRYPVDEFAEPQHGKAIWAPALRYHNGEFSIYVGDPDRGIFMTKSKDPAGPWDQLRLIRKVTGWIDPCPLWDDDGNAYLVHAFANSRVGIKSILAVNRMNKEGTQILDDGIVVFVGHKTHPTIEGPKFYKRNGYYYIFAPAGGVKPGWQTVLRSKNVFGPYEDKIVLEQGKSSVNGPHQGSWVVTQTGEDWFVHFQDRYAYGRIVHLQPMRWELDWPVIGVDRDGNGIGEPVASFKKPNVGKTYPLQVPQTSDEFDSASLGLQWQWEANYQSYWFSTDVRKGWLRLYPQQQTASYRNLWNVANLLLQKMPAPSFSATTKLDFMPQFEGEKAGLVVFGMDYASITIEISDDGYRIVQTICTKAESGSSEVVVASASVSTTVFATNLFLRVTVRPESEKEIVPKVLCSFSYSVDGEEYTTLGKEFVAREGQWVGAKVGVFTLAGANANRLGFTDFDWFRIEAAGGEKP
ncbi:MAG: glycoside hydrolase [Ignavibacteria bacterium GWA2_54_16]|nr:MAG: glycoside hydrolase [Ignavibacteria bacterium GWA2_54_16]